MTRALMTRPRLALAAFLTWLVLFAVAFANGALRVLVLEPHLGAAGLPIAGVSGVVLLGLIAGRFAWRTRPSVVEALAIGFVWLCLTLAVELVLTVGTGRPAQTVADTFTFAALARGELFAPMVLWMAAIPAAIAWWRRGGWSNSRKSAQRFSVRNCEETKS